MVWPKIDLSNCPDNNLPFLISTIVLSKFSFLSSLYELLNFLILIFGRYCDKIVLPYQYSIPFLTTSAFGKIPLNLSL